MKKQQGPQLFFKFIFPFLLLACGKASNLDSREFLIKHIPGVSVSKIDFHDFQVPRFVFEKSMVLEKDLKINAREVVFKSGVTISLKEFNLHIRSEIITFGKNVSIQGFSYEDQAPCFQDGKTSGNLALISDYSYGELFTVSLLGQRAGFVGLPFGYEEKVCNWEFLEYTKSTLPLKYSSPKKGGDSGIFIIGDSDLLTQIDKQRRALGSPRGLVVVFKASDGLEEFEVLEGHLGSQMTICKRKNGQDDECR